jgi:hypothetical protein
MASDRPSADQLQQIVSEILAGMSLKEKSLIAHMSARSLPYLQYAFDIYIERQIGNDPELGREIIQLLWERLQETHRIRLVR